MLFFCITTCLLPLLLLQAVVVTAHDLKIVQLGDSFSSGSGARSTLLGRARYEEPFQCHRTPDNWGERYAKLLEHRYGHDVLYINRACAGTSVRHLTEPYSLRRTVAPTERGTCPSAASTFPIWARILRSPVPDDVFYQFQEVPGEDPVCRLMVDAQIDALDETVDMVLMTILANDASLGAIVADCLIIPDALKCEASVERGISVGPVAQSALEEALMMMADKMKRPEELTPTGKVVILTYPYLVLDIDYFLEDSPTGTIVNAAEGVRSLTLESASRQAAAASAVNAALGTDFVILFEDTKEIFATHEADPRPRSRNPSSWLNELKIPYIEDSYHPNRQGHIQLARALVLNGTFGILDDE